MYQKILVPLDGSQLAECVLPHLEAIAKGCQAKNVIFVRVVEPVPRPIVGEDYTFSAEEWTRMESEQTVIAENYLNQLVSRLNYDWVGVQSEIITGGSVSEGIADYAARNEVDLIIIATHGRSGISRWVWGSVADRVLRSAHVPVLIVRAPGCAPGT